MDSTRDFASHARSRKWIAFAAGVLGITAGAGATADPAVGVTVGTTGLGADVNIPILPVLGLRAPPGSSACTQLQNSVAAERAQLASDVTVAKWYPVLNLGVSLRF